MLVEARLSDWRPAAALIPGLLHFAGDSPIIRPAERVRRIRLFIPAVGELRLARLTIKPRAPDTLVGAQVRQSSFRDGKVVDPAQLLSSRAIHTAREAHPFWEIVFPEPIAIDSILIGNLLSRGAAAAYGLNVELEDEHGRSWRWANDDRTVLRERLQRLEAQAALFFEQLSPGLRNGPLAQDAAARLGMLLSSTAIAVDEGQPATDPLAQRIDVLAALTSLVASEASDKSGILHRARPLLTALTERRRRKRAMIKDCEFEALSMVAAATLLEKGSMGRGQSAEDGEFLRDTADVNRVEARVNALFLEAGGDQSQTPFMFRKHGLLGPVLLRDVAGHLDALEDVIEALAAQGFPAAICYGTLLGAVREKGFIAHDDDVDVVFDLAVPLSSGREALQTLRDRLVAAGVVTQVLETTQMLKIRSPRTGIVVDAFPLFDAGAGEVIMAMEKIKLRAVPRSLVLPFAPIRFYGRSFAAPADPAGFLANRYGASWTVPIREFAGGKAA